MNIKIGARFRRFLRVGVVSLGVAGLLLGGAMVLHEWRKLHDHKALLEIERANYQNLYDMTSEQLASVSSAFAELSAIDQKVRNDELEALIAAIETVYEKSVGVYESLVELREMTKKTEAVDDGYADILRLLTERNYASAEADLQTLESKIRKQKTDVIASFQIPVNVPSSNSPPGSGYARQVVSTSIGELMVSVVAADLNTTRVIVDTASGGDCGNDCPVLALADYVSRSGGFAGINGPYFCPASYPSCGGKTNSFDTLLMNKDKVYFNSSNNVYSNVPAVIFSGSGARFVGASKEWGRDTGVDSVIAAQPRIVAGGQVAFNGDGDPKKGSKSGRSFIGTTGSTVYIGVVHNATVAEAGYAVQALGVQDALNLDGGGSVALWSGGYKVGPGRNTPFGIVLQRK